MYSLSDRLPNTRVLNCDSGDVDGLVSQWHPEVLYDRDKSTTSPR